MKKSLTDLDLKDRVAIVTGAAGGIGQAIVEVFDELGVQIMLSDVDEVALDSVVSRISASKKHALASADLGDWQSCTSLIERTVNKFGKLDILVNAGAVLKRQDIEEINKGSFDLQVRVNMQGPLALCQAAYPHLKESGNSKVILFSSQGGHTGGHIGSTVYSMTKAAVLALTKNLARQWAADGICVNAIAPGAVDTPMLTQNASQEDLQHFVADMIPMKRIAQPEEMALGCAYLASSWASYLTGHCLDLSGGQVMR